MKFLAFVIIAFLQPVEGKANTRCIYFIGSGSYFAPVAEKTFQNDLKAMKKRWGEKCTDEIILFSTGQDAQIYNSEANSYEILSKEFKNVKAATKKNLINALAKSGLKEGDDLRLYIGDHGSPEGACAIDGTITSKLLTSYFSQAQKKGVKVKAMFDHCYSGNLLPSLYQAPGATATGCGLASTSSRVGYDDAQFTGIPGSIKKIVATNQNFSNRTLSTANNFHLSTSKKFLLDYADRFPQKKNYPQCSEFRIDQLEKEMGLALDGLKSKVYSDLAFELDLFNKDSKSCEKKMPFIQHSPSLPDSASSLSNSENFQLLVRTAFERHMRETPSLGSIEKQYSDNYHAVKTCSQLQHMSNPSTCSRYPSFVSAYQAYQSQEKKFEDQISVRDVYLMAGRKHSETLTPLLDMTATAYLDALQNDLLNSTQLEVCEEKSKAYFKYKYSLIHMMKTNDMNAINTYRHLLACEEGEI